MTDTEEIPLFWLLFNELLDDKCELCGGAMVETEDGLKCVDCGHYEDD